jgi:hypothetical protein
VIVVKIAGIAFLWLFGLWLNDYTRRHGKP